MSLDFRFAEPRCPPAPGLLHLTSACRSVTLPRCRSDSPGQNSKASVKGHQSQNLRRASASAGALFAVRQGFAALLRRYIGSKLRPMPSLATFVLLLGIGLISSCTKKIDGQYQLQ